MPRCAKVVIDFRAQRQGCWPITLPAGGDLRGNATVQIPILLLTIWVIMGKSSNFSKPHLSSSLKYDNSYFMRLYGRINEMMAIKKSILHSAWHIVSS